jgi:hypothetical protein
MTALTVMITVNTKKSDHVQDVESRSPGRGLRSSRFEDRTSVGASKQLEKARADYRSTADQITGGEDSLPSPIPCDHPYDGHFMKRWTVSGEYQVKLAMMLRIMHPAKNWSQYFFFSLWVLASGLTARFACMQAATAPLQISFLHSSPAGDA